MHAAALGIGERVGNTPMDLLLVNLVVMGVLDRDLTPLMPYCDAVSEACGVPIPDNYPVVGRVLAKAKESTTVLTEAEILSEVYR